MNIKKHEGDFSDQLEFALLYPEYLHFKKYGGEYQSKFYEPLLLDKNRISMFNNLTYQEILNKFPSMTKNNYYSEESYRHKNTQYILEKNPNSKILWFDKKNGSGWYIIFDDKVKEVMLIKG